MIRAFAGTLGLFLLIFAIAVGAYAAISKGQTRTSEALSAPPQQQIVRKAVVTDRTVKAGDLSWTVSDASQRSVLRSFTLPPNVRHGAFLTLDFVVENTSQEPVTLTGYTMLLKWGEDTARPAADDNSTFVRSERDLLFTEYGLLEPGEKAVGRVNFDLSVPFGITSPEEASRLVVVLGDADPTARQGRAVDLTF